MKTISQLLSQEPSKPKLEMVQGRVDARLKADVAAILEAQGRTWQKFIDAALRAFLEEQRKGGTKS